MEASNALSSGPPRTFHSFSLLPAELKAIIVGFAHENDVAYTASREARRQRLVLAASDEEVETALMGRWRSSTNALFEVNKELRSLAAAYVFKTIRVSRCRLPVFQYGILHLYAVHFREIDFEYFVYEEDFNNVAASIMARPHVSLQSVRMRGHAVRQIVEIMSPDPDEEDWKEYFAPVFRRGCAAMRDPRLDISYGASSGDTAAMLRQH